MYNQHPHGSHRQRGPPPPQQPQYFNQNPNPYYQNPNIPFLQNNLYPIPNTPFIQNPQYPHPHSYNIHPSQQHPVLHSQSLPPPQQQLPQGSQSLLPRQQLLQGSQSKSKPPKQPKQPKPQQQQEPQVSQPKQPKSQQQQQPQASQPQPKQPKPQQQQQPQISQPKQQKQPKSQQQLPQASQSQQPQQHQHTIEVVDAAVTKAHRKLISSGESVTAWKVANSVVQALHSDSWNSLGYKMQQIPSLLRLMRTEGRVNAFIHCFVEVRKITSLYDLELEVCKNEGVKKFNELQLGPWLRHPLALHYFSVPRDTKEVHKITSQDIISYLVEFMDCFKQNDIHAEEFVDFLAMKQEVPAKEKLCIRIQNLRMHINSIKEARKSEDSSLNNCLQMKQSSKKQNKKVEGKPLKHRLLLPQKKVLDKRFNAISQRIKSFSPIQGFSDNHIRFSSSSSEDENDGNLVDSGDDQKDDDTVSSQCKISSQRKKVSDRVSRCPYPSATEEMKRLGLKIEMGGQSSPASSGHRSNENNCSTGKKRKSEDQTVDAQFPPKLPKQDRGKVNVLGVLETGNVQAQSPENKLSHAGWNEMGVLMLTDDTMEKFITTWKEACRLQSVTEVFDRMLQFYKIPDRRRRKLRSMFSSFPCIAILHVAVSSIKYGMGDSPYDTFQAIGERGCNSSVSASAEPEMIDIEPSGGRDALSNKGHLSQLECSATLEDIIKKFHTYFELNNTIPREGKPPIEKQIMLLRTLNNCKKWVKKQFSVTKFDSLGFGEFFQFIEEHTSLLPNAMFESLSEDVSKKSPMQVFMLQHQLIKLLSQATSSLWENDIITKQHVELLLKKQFPLISFQVSGNDTLEGGREFVKKHANNDISSSVLFSVSLLRTYYMSHSFVQDEFHSSETQVESDFGQTTGALGSVSAKDAIQCLLKAPMLSDLLSWSHWDLIYAPSLGPLVEWLLSEAPTEELLCLVTKDGKIIRIDHSATVDGFLEALIRQSSYHAAVNLLSLFSLYGGETHVPLSLLKCHSRKGIELILKNSLDHMIEENTIGSDIHGKPFRRQHLFDENNTVDALLSDLIMHVDKCADQDRIRRAVPVASRFILDCLGNLPPEFHSFAADIFLSGLHSFTKDAPKAVLHECKQDNQRLMLHDIGLSLNILEWITDYHAFSCATTNDMFISAENSTIKATSPTSYLASMVTPDTLENALIANSEATVTAEPEKHNDYSAVHDGLDDVREKNGGVGSKFLPEDNSNVDASLFIENIRREEFGLDPSITLAESAMLKKQHARLGRALQCLSQELYSQDSHFLLELVQNADDNIYPENVEPTLVFILHSTGIIVLNNERGFDAQNIRALCDVGNSTKKESRAGYIGQKGIGFKSVFRVTDAPEIHSNGFHVKFDVSEGQIGFVLPTVIPPCDIGSFGRLIPVEVNQTDSCWNTCVMLPFKSKLREGAGMSTIISMFCDLHPSLLLFLHRLRCIKLKNMLNDSSIVLRREIVGNGIIRVSQGNEYMCWFVATEKFKCSVIRPDVQSTEIAVAFTLQESSNGEYRPHLDQQPVFAFLPLRTYGLKFILQGDFVLPSSREEVDGDSAWNQWLLSEFPGLFVRAQRNFCTLHCFQESPGKGVEAYMSFVPLIGEVHGFFAHLPRMIISKLRVSDCLLLEGHKEEWVPPGRVLRGWDEQVCVLLPDSLLQQHLGLGYLDKDIMLSDSLAKALGIHEYGPSVLVDIVSSICRSDDGIRSMGFDWLLSWFNAFYMALVHSSGQVHNAGTDANLNESLRKIPFIPLSDGTYSSVAEGTIWLPCDAFSGGFEGEHDTKAFPTLYAKLRTVNPTFLSAAALNPYSMEEDSTDNVIRMLCKIGVQRLSAHELIKLHILPALYDDKIPNRETDLMEEYLSFVMVHLQSNCPRCHIEREHIMSELKTKAFVLTNHGYKRSADVAIHFSKEFGNPVDMVKLVDIVSFKWHEVDSIYLKHSSSKPVSFGLTKWREFFQELGVTDFVRIVQVEKNIADVSQAILKNMLYSGDLIVPGTVAKDWESPELVHLLTTLSSQDSRHKSIYLLEVLDKMWDDCLSAKVKGLCIYKSIEDGKQFKSSFLNSIHDFKWVASSFDQSLHYPKDLFYDCEEVRSFLGNFVPYAVPQIRSEKFVTDMGFKTRVTLDDALEILELWRSSKTPLTASIGDMSKFYAFIRDEVATAKVKISEVFSSLPSIFVPDTNLSGHEDVVSGKLFPSNEVYWDDPTGSVNLAREIFLQRDSLDAPCYPLNMILSHCYQSLHDFFVDDCKVGETPPVRSYIEILLQLSNVSLPSRTAKAVFRILLKWADDLNCGLLEPEDVVYLKECFLKLENAVFPTVRDKWVSLHPSFGLVCWCDDEELRRQFEHSENIDFMYFGELSLHEKEMLPTKISSLMQTLGVPSLSEVITRRAIFYGSENCREKAVMINWILPYAQRYIYNIHPDKYFQLKQSGFEKLRHLQIVAVQKLFYQLAIKGCDSSSKVQHQCNSLLQGNILYVNRVSDSHSIFLELSRLFFNGNPELHLANFLHMIMIMADTGSTEEQTEYFIMNSQKVSKLPDEEPVWFLSSLLSLQEESVKLLPDCSSTTRDEQNLLKSRRPSPNNWCTASWKTAPDSSYTPRNWFRTKLGSGPSSEVSDQVYKGESFKYTEHHGIPIGIGVDWVPQDDAVDIAGALSLQDFNTMNDQLASVGSSDPLHGRTDCSSEVLNKPAGAIMVPENLKNIQFNEKDQLQFGTPNAQKAVVTGRVGEHVAFKYLIEKAGGANVRWVNEQAETGLPYDIVIGENEDSKEYVEVKSTKSARKDWFSISTREWQFALEKGESFSIAHVLLGPKNTNITLYKNPLKLCQQGVLQLAVLVPKT